MKLGTGALPGPAGHEQCGQVLRGSILGERCGEVVSHVCDRCGIRICWLHTHNSERMELCPACAENHRALAMEALRGALGNQKLTDSARLRAIQAAVSRLAAQMPKQVPGLRRIVNFGRKLWWRLWGG